MLSYNTLIEMIPHLHYNNKTMSRCFVMLKPGVVNRRLVGEVIERLEKKGFKLVAMKMVHVSQDLASKHYAEHEGKPFYEGLVDYITSGPVIAMVWQADDCVPLIRKFVFSDIDPPVRFWTSTSRPRSLSSRRFLHL